MAALGSQSIASSFEQLLHVDRDGGGNGTDHVSVKDGDNETTFGFTIATDALMMTGTNRLEFGDTGTYIHQSADGVLDLVSDTELELNATTIDMNGAVVQDGGNFTINEDSGDYDFRVEANGNDSALVMDGGQGFVGIGASKPGYINADDSSGNGDHRGGNTQTTSGSGGLLHLNGLVPRIILEDTGDNPHFAKEAQEYFSIVEVSDSATTETTRLKINSSGNLGLGSAGSESAPALFLNNDSNTGFFQPAADGKAISINGTEKFSIKNDGNCVIKRTTTCSPGDSSFALKAYTSGKTVTAPIARFASNVTSSDTTHCLILLDGDLENTNNSYGAISDERVKENIVDANPQLNKLNQVQIRNFNRIGSDLKQIGVIAQELESVFPGLVTERTCDDGDPLEKGEMIKKVKMSVFVPIMIKAIQEIVTRLESLEG